MDIRDVLRMAVEMADTSSKIREQPEKRRADIVKAVKEGAGREEIRKLLDEHYKKVDENFNISLEEKVMKEAMKHSDTATDSAFMQAITALKEANEKMDEFGKELQLDCLCGANEKVINQDELFKLLGFVQASCEYSEFMFRCIYETLTERIEKLRKENEEIVRKYKMAIDNLDAVLKERSEKYVPKCFGEYFNNPKQCERIDCEYRTECKVLSVKNEKEKVKEKVKEKKNKTIPEMLKGIHEEMKLFDMPLPECYGKCIPCTEKCVSCRLYGVCMAVSKSGTGNNGHE